MGERGRHLTEDERRQVAEALVSGEYGSATKVADALDVHRNSVYEIRRQLMTAGLEAMRASREQSPADRHDEAFWRRRAASAEKRLEAMDAVVRKIGVLDGFRLREPSWAWGSDRPTGRRGRSVLIVHNSDRHFGEVVRPTEINGWNEYNPEICERRVQRFMNAACEMGSRWTSDTDCQGVLYTMAGDEISGDIHEELRETNEITSLEQVEGAAALHVACLRRLLEVYPRIHVMAVPGNHGRTTHKPTAKRYGALSYDTMIARRVADVFADDDRMSFQIADGPDAWYPVFNRPILVSHGDKMGTGGGQGFAGPVLPIIRGAHKMQAQYSAMAEGIYLILCGHYHYSCNPPRVLGNGSVVGLSEYGFGLRGDPGPPRQWLALMHERWGLRERNDVQLEEPPRPPKPRVRAGSAA